MDTIFRRHIRRNRITDEWLQMVSAVKMIWLAINFSSGTVDFMRTRMTATD